MKIPFLYELERYIREIKGRKNKIGFLHYGFNFNFGDMLNHDILRYMDVEYYYASNKDCDFISIGSILEELVSDKKLFCKGSKIVNIWGTGFMLPIQPHRQYFKRKVNICALRGVRSKERCEDILGESLDGIALGDPGLLISKIFPMENVEKKFDIGVIPHYIDKESEYLKNIQLENKTCKFIDIQGNTKDIARQMNECRFILSSSLHGLIAADSYEIPNKWVKFSDKIGGGYFKYQDYYSVFNIENIVPIDLREKIITDEIIEKAENNYSIKLSTINNICNSLLEAFPL